MTTRRATLDEIEREIERRIESAVSGLRDGVAADASGFGLGHGCGEVAALRSLRRWLTDEMRSRDGVSTDDEGELRRPTTTDGETRRR